MSAMFKLIKQNRGGHFFETPVSTHSSHQRFFTSNVILLYRSKDTNDADADLIHYLNTKENNAFTFMKRRIWQLYD